MATCSKGWTHRCPASKGPKCRCSCGGANHGTITRRREAEAKRHARFSIVRSDANSITIRDEGPWDEVPTVTNDAEDVVRRMIADYGLGSRRLFYYDSDGELTELVVENGAFARYAAVRPRTLEVA